MIWKINSDVFFAKGAYCGAIYDLTNNKVYSINHESCKFLSDYINSKTVNNQDEKDYLDKLFSMKLLASDYQIHEYYPDKKYCNHLDFAWLEITQTCNLKCVHCYEGEVHKLSSSVLSTAQWKEVIRQLDEVGCNNIQFIGGEPACYGNVVGLIDYAGTLRFKSIGFFTNATLITQEMIDCFVKNKVNVNVSIYGHTADIHDGITQQKGSFNNTECNVKRLLANGIDVTVAITIMQENEQYYENIVNFLKSIGVKKYKFDLVRPVKNCYQNCHLAGRQDLIKQTYRTEPKFKINKEQFERSFDINTCWFGKFAITDSGNVIPCVFERDIIYGNLNTATIKDILSSEELNMYWHFDFSQIDECKDCEFRFACKDCRPLGLLNGGLNKKNMRCYYNPSTGIWGGKGDKIC